MTFGRFRHCRRGTVTTLLALLLPILAMGSVGVAEISEVMLAKSKLQSYVDAAALQGAGEFGVDQSDATTERTRLYADDMAAPLRLRWSVTSTASINAATRAITVSQTAHRRSFFGNLLPPGGWNIAAVATAVRTARKPLCVLGSMAAGHPGHPGHPGLGASAGILDIASSTITLEGSSSITASDCLVQSNANLYAGQGTLLRAGEARAVGSASGPIRPAPVTDAPLMTDPFATMRIDMPLPVCDVPSLNIGTGTFYLKPGVHCGIITVHGSANVVLSPGEHYFVGPLLSIGGRSTVTGTDVVIVITNASTLQVTGTAVLNLEGRKSGPYAGFVMISDRNFIGDVQISTSNARKLVGTIYLPNASLTVHGINNKVADRSPWTVVVARTIRTLGSANLVINASYNSSSVPVPAGVGPPKDQPVRLAQ
ncbi:pilus assembly protein TadG-related protein [Methylobacterium terricola]|uniref:pilus assembly protein TadG-related protein n=1 Tax=Methylobacterium terricola TaxID=2583531 RepID=UPI0014863794|nr:pilus assembly protein TadG-related protein [Methylobacterium terricola]